MTDKDDKKPKPGDDIKDTTTPGTEAGSDAADARSKEDDTVTSEQEVVEVVAAGAAVPVTEVDADKDAGADRKDDEGDTAGDQPGNQSKPEDDMLTAPPPPVAQPPRRSDGAARFLAFVAILIALGVGATTILPQINGGSADRIAKLQGDIAALSEQNRALTARVAEAAPTAAPQPVDLSGIETRLEALEAAQASVASLQERLAALEAGGGADTATAPTVTQADLDAVRDEVASLADSLAALGSAPAGSTPAVADAAGTEALASELGELEQRLSVIENSAGDAGATTRDLRDSLEALRDRMAALASETDALSSRIEAVASAAEAQQSQADADAAQKAALVLALGRLRDVAATGAAFPGAWNSVVELGVDADAHPAIADAAQHGVPTTDELRLRFPAVADAALTAERIGGDDTWYGAAFQRLGNLVSVRRVGEVEGTGVEAIVTRAEFRLQEGNLEAALAELDGLSGPPAEAVAPWRATAQSRLDLEQAIRALQQGVFQNMSQGN